jgi:dTDP-4-dehydrorhamnose reductase
MKILITGKDGQVGRAIVDLLNSMSGIRFLALNREQLDITNANDVNKVVTEFNPDIIINAAAYTAVDRAEQESELVYAINRDGPYHLALAANDVNALIIHLSTDYVFSGNSAESYVESDETGPQSEYGCSKLAGEQVVAQACPRHIILRTAWVFGEYGNNFVKTMLCLAKTRESLGVVSDQFGGPTYAGDIARAILAISNQVMKGNQAYGVYHYSGFPHVSWYDFAQTIFSTALQQGVLKHSIKVSPITTLDYPTPAKRPANSRLNCYKINNVFGIQQSDWQAALTQIQEYS